MFSVWSPPPPAGPHLLRFGDEFDSKNVKNERLNEKNENADRDELTVRSVSFYIIYENLRDKTIEKGVRSLQNHFGILFLEYVCQWVCLSLLLILFNWKNNINNLRKIIKGKNV